MHEHYPFSFEANKVSTYSLMVSKSNPVVNIFKATFFARTNILEVSIKFSTKESLHLDGHEAAANTHTFFTTIFFIKCTLCYHEFMRHRKDPFTKISQSNVSHSVTKALSFITLHSIIALPF